MSKALACVRRLSTNALGEKSFQDGKSNHTGTQAPVDAILHPTSKVCNSLVARCYPHLMVQIYRDLLRLARHVGQHVRAATEFHHVIGLSFMIRVLNVIVSIITITISIISIITIIHHYHCYYHHYHYIVLVVIFATIAIILIFTIIVAIVLFVVLYHYHYHHLSH